MPTNANADMFDGGWTHYVDPRAVYYSNTYNRTYFGWVDTDGTVKASHYDHDTGQPTVPVELIDFAPDDHNNPSFLVRSWSDHKVMVFYTDHNDTDVRLRLSSAAEDLTLVDAEQTLQSQIQGEARLVNGPDFSYPQPFYLADESKIYLFFRNFPITGYSTSADSGTTWTAETVLFEDGDDRPYIKTAQYGTGRIVFAVTAGHPGEVWAQGRNNTLHFCYYEGGGWYNVRGGNLGDLPLLPRTDLEMVDDGHTWVWDVAVESDGTPRIFYTVYPDGGDGDDRSTHIYKHARWNGRKWDVTSILAPGAGPTAVSPYYSGAGTFDKSDPNIIYLSARPDGVANLEIFRYESSDNGLTWQMAKQYTYDSAYHCQRPYAVYNGVDTKFRFMYMTGDYPTYSTNDTVVRWLPK